MIATLPGGAGIMEVLDRAHFMVCDLRARILHWSTGAERLYGWARQDAIGRISHHLLATEFPAPLPELQKQLLSEGEWHGELRQRTRDGRRIHVASHWSLQRDTLGNPTVIAEVNNDITPLREADAAQYRLASIVASSHDAIMGIALDGLITDWNAAAADMFGYSAAETLGHPVSMLYPPDRLSDEATILERLRRGEKLDHFETIRRRKSGEMFPASVTASPIRDATGAIVGASKIVRDLSERWERERRLEEMRAELVHISRLTELGQLVSAFVHEINQPLTAISNYAQGIRASIAAGNQARVPEAMQRIVEQTERAHQIIRRTRGYLKKDSSQVRRESVPEMIREAIALATIGTAARGAKIETVFAEDAEFAEMDKIQIEQVVFNLIRNALEAMQKQETRIVRIQTRATAHGEVQVTIADRGPGLAGEVREKLFQPFVTTKPGGMGVGLSVCHSIIEAHAGRLWAEDNPEGGAAFHFTVPVSSSADHSVRALAQSRSESHVTGLGC